MTIRIDAHSEPSRTHHIDVDVAASTTFELDTWVKQVVERTRTDVRVIHLGNVSVVRFYGTRHQLLQVVSTLQDELTEDEANAALDEQD